MNMTLRNVALNALNRDEARPASMAVFALPVGLTVSTVLDIVFIQSSVLQTMTSRMLALRLVHVALPRIRTLLLTCRVWTPVETMTLKHSVVSRLTARQLLRKFCAIRPVKQLFTGPVGALTLRIRYVMNRTVTSISSSGFTKCLSIPESPLGRRVNRKVNVKNMYEQTSRVS